MQRDDAEMADFSGYSAGGIQLSFVVSICDLGEGMFGRVKSRSKGIRLGILVVKG